MWRGFLFPPQGEPDPVPDPPPLPDDPDPDGVNFWRLEQLIRAGWPDMLAGMLATDHDVDLHRACELVRGGCDPWIAWQILT